ncbi:META domain-containing protein [Paludibacter sp. 221]|uniref:copper resistance protein NlpE N-terminal domain-containing protein n=1 Tax=Paludibacter sp. 221 TaxID=2302939 RepID=UPI0013D03D73|nr:META domain-containing protein [Paludibacter sp. 221]NDV46795.1 META domain-containing protein [Paludibacter sp. 221]
MKTTKLFFTAIVICLTAFSLGSCKKTSKTADNSNNSLDWNGIYTGVVPCADCEGIQTTIVLNLNNSYELRTKYLGKNTEEYVKTGTFEWNKEGNEITLSGIDKNEAPSKYMVGENKLVQLDTKGKRMESATEPNYTLAKASDIIEKYWKLIEVNGKEVKTSENQAKEAHFILKLENNRVNGNGGCNSFFGTYVIKNGNRISFSQMGSTMMACLNMETESQFMRALEMTDNYTVNGDTLSLNRARMAPLARFVAVYMQ